MTLLEHLQYQTTFLQILHQERTNCPGLSLTYGHSPVNQNINPKSFVKPRKQIQEHIYHSDPIHYRDLDILMWIQEDQITNKTKKLILFHREVSGFWAVMKPLTSLAHQNSESGVLKQIRDMAKLGKFQCFHCTSRTSPV